MMFCYADSYLDPTPFLIRPIKKIFPNTNHTIISFSYDPEQNFLLKGIHYLTAQRP